MCGHCLIVLPLLKLRNTVTSLLTSWVQNKYRSDTVATLFFSDCRRRRPSKTGLSRPSEIEVLAGRPKRRSKKAKRNRCQSCQAEFVFSSVVCLMLVTGMWGGRWGYVLVNDQIYLLQVIHKTDFTLVATKTAQGIVFVAVYIYISMWRVPPPSWWRKNCLGQSARGGAVCALVYIQLHKLAHSP